MGGHGTPAITFILSVNCHDFKDARAVSYCFLHISEFSHLSRMAAWEPSLPDYLTLTWDGVRKDGVICLSKM